VGLRLLRSLGLLCDQGGAGWSAAAWAVLDPLTGAAERCWRTRVSTVGPVNGGWPASISYRTQPSE